MLSYKNLKNKGCKIIFIEFPYHPILNKIESKSDIKNKTNQFKKRVQQLYGKVKIDSIELNNDRQKMHDLTHLNEEGAREVSSYLASIIKQNEIATFITIKIK